MRLRCWVFWVLFPSLGAYYALGRPAPAPRGEETGVWAGRVSTVTTRGAMMGSLWVSSGVFSGRLDRGDSLLVLGRRSGRFITPWAVRVKRTRGFFPEARRALLRRFESEIPDSLALGLSSAVLLGYRGYVPAHAVRIFRLSGTAHLLALSGMHTGIVAGVFLLFFRLLFGKRRPGAVLAVLALAGFVLLTGARPSTVRAGIMAGTAILWLTFHGGAAHPLTVWCLALLPALFDPSILDDPGAQMSYGAVLSLILLGRSWKGPAGVVLTPLWAGVVVIVSLAPLTAGLYGVVNPAGAPCTVLSLPLMGTVMALGAGGLAGLGSGLLEGVCRLWLGLLNHFAGFGVTFSLTPRNMGLWSVLMLILFLVRRGRGFLKRFR